MNREKALGLFRLRLNEAFEFYMQYGQDVQIPTSKNIVEGLALQLHNDLLLDESPDYKQLAVCLKEVVEMNKEQYRQEGRDEALKMMEEEAQPD